MAVKLPDGTEIPQTIFLTTRTAFELLRTKNPAALENVWLAVALSQDVYESDIAVLKTCGLANDGQLHQHERDFLRFCVTPGPSGSMLINGK